MFGRTVIKTIVYRLASTVLSFIMLFIFTGNVVFSGKFSIISLIISTIFYYCYEKLWEQKTLGGKNEFIGKLREVPEVNARHSKKKKR